MAIIATFCTKPATMRLRLPAPMLVMWPKTNTITYQIAVQTSVERSG
jgi:hypothetical protein